MKRDVNEKDSRSMRDCHICIRIGSKTHELTLEQAFSYGHTLLLGEHYKPALRLFRAMEKAFHADQPLQVMLARCQVGLDHYTAAKEILCSVFEDDDAAVEELHTAFVYKKFGMLDSAIREVERLLREHADLPSGYLFLGDIFAAKGRDKQAAACWNMAIQRDCPDGPVAGTAWRQLKQLDEATSRHSEEIDVKPSS